MTTTMNTFSFVRAIGTGPKALEITVEYSYTPPQRAGVYCGHDRDRAPEPAELELLSVRYHGADLLPFLSDDVIAKLEKAAERDAQRQEMRDDD